MGFGARASPRAILLPLTHRATRPAFDFFSFRRLVGWFRDDGRRTHLVWRHGSRAVGRSKTPTDSPGGARGAVFLFGSTSCFNVIDPLVAIPYRRPHRRVCGGVVSDGLAGVLQWAAGENTNVPHSLVRLGRRAEAHGRARGGRRRRRARELRQRRRRRGGRRRGRRRRRRRQRRRRRRRQAKEDEEGRAEDAQGDGEDGVATNTRSRSRDRYS